MNWLEAKYVDILTTRFQNLHKTKSYWRFSCPYCREYETSSHKRKARGYILDRGEHYQFYCHRCGAKPYFPKMLEELDSSLYKDYIKEKYLSSGSKKRVEYKEPPPVAMEEKLKNPLRYIQKISRMEDDHFAKQYVLARQIPDEYIRQLYFAPKFMTWINTMIPDKFSNAALSNDEPRLVIPFINKNNRMHAVQGRSFDKASELKYITLVLNESIPSVYGLDKYDLHTTGYVTEGPLDSMFLPNSLATAGGDIASKLSTFNKDNLIIVYDNECRSPHTIKKIQHAIKSGFKCCVWPKNIVQKDINDMILAGYSQESIKNIIDENSYSGLKAVLALNNWSKC